MKVVDSKKDEKNRTILIIESGFFKRRVEYLASSKIVGEFYKWLKLPNKELVPDYLSYQLNEWKKELDLK